MSDAPPVVLVHGFAGSTERTWRPSGWLDLLADAGRTVVGIDLRYDALESETRAALPDGVCDAVGFSLGARVLLTLASDTPERFRRLVVAGVGENLLLDEPGEALGFARYFEAQAGPDDRGVDHAVLVDAVRREISSPLTLEQLARVEFPVLVVLGDRDFAGPPEPLVDALPDARLVVLPGVDHFATPKQFGFLDAARLPRPMTDRDFVLGVDLDGVCGDYTAAFRAVVAAERGIDPDQLAEQRSWDFAEWGLSADEFHDLHRRAVLEHRMFRSMPVMAGAADVLWRLSDAGVWIRLITHRLYVNWGHAIVLEDTAAWLDTTGIPYRGDICFLGRKPEVEADVYVDDAPHNITALRAAGTVAIVYDQPYNQALAGPRARDWPDVERLVLEEVAASGRPVQEQLAGVGDGSERLRRRLTDRDP